MTPDYHAFPEETRLGPPAHVPEVAAGALGSAPIEPNWMDVALAYDEAAEHLEMCAAESQDVDERAAMNLVATRIRMAGARVKPNTQAQPPRCE